MQAEGHDLDLTYITDRVIALGLPASGIERMYRNPLENVRDFLDARHGGKYAMVNLCDERDYSNAEWPQAARILRFPFADHHTCCMGALHAFCERAATFLAEDDEHVLAVHCKAGKGRTGVMVAAYLLFAGEQADAELALHHFRQLRTTDLDAVNNPSQCHYVRLYAKLLAATPPERSLLIRGPTISLLSVSISSAPASLTRLAAAITSAPAEPAAGAAPAGTTHPTLTSGGTPNATTDQSGVELYPATIVSSAAGGGGSGAGGGAAAGTIASGGSSSVSTFASLVVPSWHLKLALYSLHTVDTADGVASVRSPVCSVGPHRCAPSQPHVAFDMPTGELRVRGDLQLSLISAGGLLAADDEIGWTHLHTSWLQHAGEDASADAGIDAGAHAQSSGSGAQRRTLTIARPAVDMVSKDGRFPPDWTLTLTYMCHDDEVEFFL